MADNTTECKKLVVVYSMLDETTGVGFGYKKGSPDRQDSVGGIEGATILLDKNQTAEFSEIYGTTSGGVVFNTGGVQIPNINSIKYIIEHPGQECKLPEIGTAIWDGGLGYYTVTHPDGATVFKENTKDNIYITYSLA